MSKRNPSTETEYSLVYTNKGGRVHLAVADDQEKPCVGKTICGLPLDGEEHSTLVPRESVPELHNALLCHNCSLFWMHGGYRDYALAKFDRPARTLLCAEAETVGENQLALF